MSRQAPGPVPTCGENIKEFVVKKIGPNTGREFYSCPCGGFQWKDVFQATGKWTCKGSQQIPGPKLMTALTGLAPSYSDELTKIFEFVNEQQWSEEETNDFMQSSLEVLWQMANGQRFNGVDVQTNTGGVVYNKF